MAVDYYYSYNQTEHKVEEEDEEDYIDMEVSSFAHFFSLSKNTPLCLPQQQQQQQHQHNREFEFQMSSSSMDVLEKQESTTSPADELFYMGKLLPLHLPPRLQMVEKLLQDSTPKMFSHYRANNNVDEFYSTPFDTNAGTTPASGHTPFESCDASPVDSCQVSRELNPEEYFRSACASNEGDDHQKPFNDSNSNSNAKKSWTKKLKTKIKSLFGKSSGDHQETAALTLTSPSVSSGLPVKLRDDSGDSENENKRMEIVISRDKEVKEAKICHRRSFSGALFKRRSSSTTTKLSSISSSSASAGLSTSSSSSSSSSSTSTTNSNGLKELLKRRSSASSEIETSLIQGAIAHCKRSSQPEAMIQSQKTLSEVGCHSFPSSRFASIDHDSSLCRG